KAGKSDEARRLVNSELAKAREAIPANSAQLAGALAQFGSSLLDLKAFAEAETLLRECLAIREEQQPDIWTTFNTRSMLGGALAGQEKCAEAEPLLVAGYTGMNERRDQVPEQGKVRLTQAVERLVDLYDALAQEDKADEWRRKLEEAKTAAPNPE
ncbi:MAG TPA: tetratricopeptide repeat protein, partial [Pirellulales bacterium]|nr:tetratricopeptide repeat protein [Pirellulales bacterium]